MQRLGIPVRDQHGGMRAVEAYRDHDTVELWFGGRLRAVFSRGGLREWLTARPDTALQADEVTWACNTAGHVRLMVEGSVPWAEVTERTARWLAEKP
jgi:hypothetical protein